MKIVSIIVEKFWSLIGLAAKTEGSKRIFLASVFFITIVAGGILGPRLGLIQSHHSFLYQVKTILFFTLALSVVSFFYTFVFFKLFYWVKEGFDK